MFICCYISSLRMARRKAGGGGEKFGEREHSPLPHILTQCGLSSCHSAFPNLQADSPCACNRVISPISALCVPQAHQYWAGVKSSRGLRMLELEQNLVAVPHPLCFAGDGIDARRWTILQSSTKWVHIFCPPHLCPFHPLGSLPSLAMILPTEDPLLWHPEVLFKSITLGRSAFLTKLSAKLSDTHFVREDGLSEGAEGVGLLLNKVMRFPLGMRHWAEALLRAQGASCKLSFGPCRCFFYAFFPPNLPQHQYLP